MISKVKAFVKPYCEYLAAFEKERT